MAFKSLVTPNLGFRVLAGNCLAMAQGIVGAAVRYNSATDAANATQYRHHNYSIPNAVCVLWFDHWGFYGLPGREAWANWGHVVIYVPGYGYASSSPHAGEVSTPYYYSSIHEVERTFNSTFRFWTEDINGTRTCEPIKPKPQPITPNPQEDDMNEILVDNKHYYTVGKQYVSHNDTVGQADIAGRVTGKTHKIPNKEFLLLLQAFGIPLEVVKGGTVKNPQSGKFERNGTWSREREILAKLGVK